MAQSAELDKFEKEIRAWVKRENRGAAKRLAGKNGQERTDELSKFIKRQDAPYKKAGYFEGAKRAELYDLIMSAHGHFMRQMSTAEAEYMDALNSRIAELDKEIRESRPRHWSAL